MGKGVGIMTCSIADFRCTYVSELIGDPILAVLILGALFFAFMSYRRVGLKTTLWLSCVYFPVISYFIVGTTFVFAIVTLVASLSLALLHTRLVGNR